ncbi:MAG: hypothetical protein U9Q12_02490, partial [Patescibacteria group bacterium]|nr:hypothetical protein [Patescibacteria group bacterium]
MKSFNKNIIFSIVAIIQIIVLTMGPLTAQAGLFGAGNVSGKVRSGINDFIESDLNLNVEDSLKPITEGINSTDSKGGAPEVSIRFSTTNPKPGDTITASADVINISNPNDAYYVWYIKGPNRVPDESTNAITGNAGGNSGELNTQHILAVQVQAALYFDPLTFDQSMNNDRGHISNGSFIDDYPVDTDDDGYKANIGGENMKNNGSNYCYMYDVEDGTQYELSEEGTNSEEPCPDGYVARCMIGERTVQCPTIIYGVHGEINTSADSSADSGGDTSASTSNGTSIAGGNGARFRILARCLDHSEEPICSNNEYSCATADDDTGTNYDYDALRTVVATPYCLPKDGSGQIWTDPNTSGCPTAKYSYCFRGEIWPEDEAGYEQMCGGAYGEERPGYYGASCHDYYEKGQLLKPDKCDVKTTDKNTCGPEMHPFPDGAGDGDFNSTEERLYHLDPRTDQTTPLALNDEALVTGLGVKDFTWVYQTGDEIGVIVEGTGVEATKHQDATSQTVFALLSPGCRGILEEGGTYEETINDKVIEIEVGNFEDLEFEEGLNKCVLENELYVKPGTSEYDSLNVELSSGSSTASQSSTASGLGQEMTISALAN